MTNKTKKKQDWAKSQPNGKKPNNAPKTSQLPVGSITTQELFDQIMDTESKGGNTSIPSWARNAKAAASTQRPTNSQKFRKKVSTKPRVVYFDVETGGLDGEPFVTYSTRKDGKDAKTLKLPANLKGLSDRELKLIEESISTVGIKPANITSNNLRAALKKYNELLDKSNDTLARGTAVHQAMEKVLKINNVGPGGYGISSQGNHEPVDFDEDDDYPVDNYEPTPAEKAATEARIAKFRARYGRPETITGNDSVSTNFMQVVPNSHFWTDLRMLRNYLKYQPQSQMRDYLLTGLKNTLNNGYDLIKLGLDAEPGQGTFWKRENLLSTTSKPLTEAEFIKLMGNKRPTEIWRASNGKNVLAYRLVSHYLAGGNKRKPGATVWYPMLGPGKFKDLTYHSIYSDLIYNGGLLAYTYR